MTSDAWYYIPVNPEPWAVGPLSVGKRGGKFFPRMGRNQSVHAFQEAVRGELSSAVMLPEGEYDLAFLFWRRIESYTGESGRTATAHVADATNMQKALEDALQGIIIDNDRNVRHVESTIVEQGVNVKPGIAIHAQQWIEVEIGEWLPYEVQAARESQNDTPVTGDNSWG